MDFEMYNFRAGDEAGKGKPQPWWWDRREGDRKEEEEEEAAAWSKTNGPRKGSLSSTARFSRAFLRRISGF